MDVDMGTSIYKNNLKEAVEAGIVEESLIDEAVTRILSVKMWLGLFEHPYVSKEAMSRYEVIPKAHLELAKKAAEKSIVLLKNEGNVLPLKKGQKVSLVGQLADIKEEVVGAWALNWRADDCISIREGMEKADDNVKYFPCCGVDTEINEEEVLRAAEYGDVIVAVLGETTTMSGEASSRADITLPGKQRAFLARLKDTGKPVVAVLMNGRPLALNWEAEHVDAMVECWHLGIQMGTAVAGVLYGKKNPEGRLASSFPQVTGQCPIYYSHVSTGRPGGKSKFTSKYLDVSHEPLYPFGYGLSYTTYTYSDMKIIEDPEQLRISVKVKNTGTETGVETVQLYMQDVTASLTRPVKELKGFEKVFLEPDEEKEVTLLLAKEKMGFYNNYGEYIKEDGLFRIYVGHSSAECEMQEIQLKF